MGPVQVRMHAKRHFLICVIVSERILQVIGNLLGKDYCAFEPILSVRAPLGLIISKETNESR